MCMLKHDFVEKSVCPIVHKCVDRTTTSLQNLENKQKFEIVWILVSLFKEENLPGFTPFQTLKWKSRKLKRCESLYIFKKGETYMDSHLFKLCWRDPLGRNTGEVRLVGLMLG